MAQRRDRVVTDRRLRAVSGVLLTLLVGFLAFLVFADPPWRAGIVARRAEGLPPGPTHYAQTYRWWITLGSAGVVALLLATLRLWIGPRDVRECADLAPPRGGGRGVALVAGLAMLAAAVLVAPRLDFPFWDDERYTVRQHVDGQYLRNHRGELVFRGKRWSDAWLYTLNRPNNHVPFTLLAKLSLDTWRAVTRPELEFASEAAVRFPALLFGLAAIGATAWLLWRVGLPWAACGAALLLAIHPWHLRYASEARGYSLMLLCVPLLLGSLVRVLQRPTWGRWIAFGGAELVLLWVYPGGAGIVGLANLALLAELWRRHRGALRAPLARWLVTSLCAATLFMLLMGANLLIFLWHMEWEQEQIRWNFLRDVLSHLWVGTAFAFRHAPERYVELADVARAAPAFFGVARAATLLLCVIGAIRLVVATRIGVTLVVVLLLPAPLTLLGAHLRQTDVHEWYVLFALPSFVILLAAGLDGCFAWLRAPRARVLATLAVMFGYLGAYAWLSSDVRGALLSTPIQPVRESVLLTRPELDPFSEANQQIMTVSWLRVPIYYDPNLHVIGQGDQLLDLLDEADRSGRDLYVNYGRPSLAGRRHPELMELVDREDLFEPVAELFGFEPRGMIRVYRYRRR